LASAPNSTQIKLSLCDAPRVADQVQSLRFHGNRLSHKLDLFNGSGLTAQNGGKTMPPRILTHSRLARLGARSRAFGRIRPIGCAPPFADHNTLVLPLTPAEGFATRGGISRNSPSITSSLAR
jgi:hypothetical protein